MFLFGQQGQFWSGWSFGNLAVAIIIFICIAAIVVVVIKNSGLAIPSWVWTILWICVLGFIAIIAIHFLMSL